MFCDLPRAGNDAEALIVWRGKKNYIILNRYPYTSGHVMVVPYAHQATLMAAEPTALAEMMVLAQSVQGALGEVYRPEGYNVGINIGKAAGAGIAGHIHMHVLPRWIGDTNFMTTVGETRLEPEDLATTYERLREALKPMLAESGH